MITPQSTNKLIIANCSGFFGDRFSAAKEMVTGGPINVLTGDYLAELTMAILFQKKLKDPGAGYVQTFLEQMKEIMSLCIEKNIKVVSDAGGLNPAGLAHALKSLAVDMGLKPKIAYIEGDDLMPRLNELQNEGENFIHLDKKISLKQAGAMPITANAYMGGWGIAEALKAGADIVVTGRVADAALVSGPCAWHFGWKRDDWDMLAGAYAAGHIIECGAQCTGGNYSFMDEVPSFSNVGFPIAEIFADGSFVITKHPNTGGLVSVGTVTAQLLYEIEKPAYLTPDVIAHFDTIRLFQEEKDRVRCEGTKGCPPTDTLKVCINTFGGHKNTMTVVLTGLDIEKKARIVEHTLWESLGGKQNFAKVHSQLIRSDKDNPATNEESFAFLKISVIDPDPKKVGKLFSAKIVELALANIPGFTLTAPPGKGTPFIVHWPCLISAEKIKQKVVIEEQVWIIETIPAKSFEIPAYPAPALLDIPEGDTVAAPLGSLFASRAGDKGGNANLGIWAKTPNAFAFLKKFLTTEKLKELLPDCESFDIDRYELPNLLALNFYIRGILGEGAAASFRSDPQAKTLGEYLRSKVVKLPKSLNMN
jgi:hypothetical protein